MHYRLPLLANVHVLHMCCHSLHGTTNTAKTSARSVQKAIIFSFRYSSAGQCVIPLHVVFLFLMVYCRAGILYEIHNIIVLYLFLLIMPIEVYKPQKCYMRAGMLCQSVDAIVPGLHDGGMGQSLHSSTVMVLPSSECHTPGDDRQAILVIKLSCTQCRVYCLASCAQINKVD